MTKPEKGIKTGLDKIIEYFNIDLEENHPIAIAKVVEDTGFSWSFVRKTLAKIKENFESIQLKISRF